MDTHRQTETNRQTVTDLDTFDTTFCFINAHLDTDKEIHTHTRHMCTHARTQIHTQPLEQ